MVALLVFPRCPRRALAFSGRYSWAFSEKKRVKASVGNVNDSQYS